MGCIDELTDVKAQRLAVRVVLGRNGARIAEGFAPGRRRAGGIAGKILVIDEDVRTVGTNESGNVGIQAVSQERDFDALARDRPAVAVEHRLRLRRRRIQKCRSGELQRLGLQGAAQSARRTRGACAGNGIVVGCTGRPVANLLMDDPVGHHGLHHRMRGELLRLRRRNAGGKRIDGAERGYVARARLLQLADQGTLRCRDGRCSSAHGAARGRYVGQLIAQDDDDVALRQLLRLGRRHGVGYSACRSRQADDD